MLEIQHLSKSIGTRQILDNITISFSNGLTCIVGDSGAGKSTLLNILGGLDFPTAGGIFLTHAGESRNVSEITHYQQNYLGFVFQDANLINGLTVYENIAIAAQIAGKEIHPGEIYHLLEQFGLSGTADTKAECVSGGEKLRAAIARAVIKDAPIILADEPTGSLDSKNSLQVFELLKNISKDRIVIAVTHNVTMAETFADRIVTLCDGKISNDEHRNANDPQAGRKEASNHLPSKNHLASKVIKQLTVNNIKRFRSKFMLSFISMGIAFAVIAIMTAMHYDIHVKTEELNTVYYDADVITFYPYELGEKSTTSIIMGGNYGTVTDEMIQDLSDSHLFREVIPVCNTCYYVSGSVESIPVKLIHTDDFFRSRLMTDKVIGEFPTESNQVIIAKNLSDSYYGGDAIGKTLSLANDFGDDILYEIVGINAEKNVDGVCYTYLPLESVKHATYSNLFSGIYLAESVEDDSKEMYTEDSSGFLDTQTEETVIFGNPLTGPHQILISSDMARELYFSLTGTYIDVSPGGILNADSQLKDCLNSILEQSYYIGANDAYVCKVVGIHDGLSYQILVSDDWKDSITRALPNYVECYGKDMSTVIHFADEELASKYPYVSNYEERFETAVSTTGMWSAMFGIILIITAILCVFMMHSYAKAAISGRMYEIGVLGSLGLSERKRKKLLCTEIYILGMGAWGCGSLIFLSYLALSSIFLDYHFKAAGILLILFLLLAGSVLISVFIANYEAGKAAKITVINAIRMRE